MVSVKRCSLPSEYINAACELINALEGNHSNRIGCRLDKQYNIDYAYFYLRYDEDQEWYDGDWWLCIATNDIDHHQEGTRIVLDTIKLLNIDLPEFDFIICSPNIDAYNIHFDKIVIKEFKDMKLHG